MNIGYINRLIVEQLSQLNENKTTNSILNEYVTLIKNNPILIAEQNIFNSFKTKNFKNDIIATNYINDKLSELKSYSQNDLKLVNESLNEFKLKYNLNQSSINNNKIDDDINNVLNETLSINKNIDILYESMSNIVDYMVNNKNTEQHLKELIESYNNKFKLSTDDIEIIKQISESKYDDKLNLLNNLKNETINLVTNIKDETTQTMVNEMVDKINSIDVNKDTINENIMDLYELKKDLI